MAIRLIDAKAMNTTTPFNSPSIHLHEACRDHTVELDYVDANASVSAMTVILQATANDRGVEDADAIWHDLVTYALTAGDITNKRAMFHVANKTVQRVRVQVYSITGGASVDLLTVRYIPKVAI